MTYTPASLLTGYVRPNPAWEAVLAQHGAVPDAEDIVAEYENQCAVAHMDTNLALAQACLESAWFTSARWKNEWNPAGLGITADNTPPNPFASYDEGIRAHIEHLCCYAYTAATCPYGQKVVDRRHTFHDGKPRVADLIRPDRKWAVPGTGYVAHIVQIANDVTGGTNVTAPWDRIHLSADQGPDRPISDVRWFVVHDTEGSFPGDEAVLTSAAPPVESVHFLVGRVPGQCVYSVPITATAWTAGNDQVSAQAIQVELSRNPVLGETDYTAYQYTKLAQIFLWCKAQGMDVPVVYIGRVDADGGPEPDVPGIIGHQDVPDGNGGWGGSSHHTDPGPTFQWDRLVALIGGGPSAPFVQDGNPYGAIVVHPTFWPRLHYLDTLGLALPHVGYAKPQPIVTLHDGRTAQRFERAWLAGTNPADVVALFPEEYPT